MDLLPRDPSDPWPTQITNDVDAFRQETLRKEINAKRERAVKAFQRPWLLEMEQQLHECTALLQQRDLDHERRRSMEAYRKVLQDKLKNFHRNAGTINCEFALEQRKRWCIAQGLLRKNDRRLVVSLFQTLPTEDDGESLASASSQGNVEVAPVQDNIREDDLGSDSEESMFITPVPNRSGALGNTSNKLESTNATSKRRRGLSRSQRETKRVCQTNTINKYFLSQK